MSRYEHVGVGGGGRGAPAAERSELARSRRALTRRALSLVLLSAVVGLGLGVASSEMFAIRTVRVVCTNPSLQVEAMERVQRITFGTIWLPPTRAIERQIGGLPRAKAVTIGRTLPDTLTIEVEPRVPVAFVVADDRLMAVDDEGVCLHWTGAAPPDKPTLRIEDPSVLAVGGRLRAQDVVRLREISRGLAECDLLEGASIDLSHPLSISVFTADGLLGKLGNDELLYEKARLLGELAEALRAQGRKPLYIDLRVPSRPTYKPIE